MTYILVWRSIQYCISFSVSGKIENETGRNDTRLCKCWQFPCFWVNYCFNHDSSIEKQQSWAYEPALLPTHLSDVPRSWSKRLCVHTTLDCICLSFQTFPMGTWFNYSIWHTQRTRQHLQNGFQSARRGWLSWVIWITKSSMHVPNPCTDGNAARALNPAH